MADIATYLEQILAAVYGEEVRGSIHDALAAINAESISAMNFAKSAKDSAANSAAVAKQSEESAVQKAADASKAAAAAQKSETNARASESVVTQKAKDATDAAAEAKASQQEAANSEAIATQKAANAETSANAAALSESKANAAEERIRSLKSETEQAAAQVSADKEIVESAKQETTNSQKEAKKSADTAVEAKTAAESAKDEAVAAKESVSADALAAQTAREGAESASLSASESASSASKSAEIAQQYSGKPPKIDPVTKTWWIWHADSGENGEYVDTHLSSEIAGPPGTGITSITLKSGNHAPGTIDTYAIEMSDGNSFEFTVRNGHDGEGSGDVLGRSFDLTIPKDSWADGQATVENEQFLAMATYKYLIGSDESCRDEYGGCGVKAKDITTSGQITFICNTDPARDLVVNVLRFELSAVG